MELWQKENNFVIMAYYVIADFIGDEKFGLISQMRRATLSIPANIAEGLRRKSKKELISLAIDRQLFFSVFSFKSSNLNPINRLW